MNKYVLTCCSTCDLTIKKLNDIDVKYICFKYEMDGKIYKDDLWETLEPKDFFAKVDAGANVKTSQSNTNDFIEFFEPFLKDGKDILHICMSSGITGVINSATEAKNLLIQKYPNRKIYVVDSLDASSGLGLVMDTLSNLRKQGMSIDELKDWIELNKLRVHHWFWSMDLTQYIKGGRISKAAGFFGKMLNICPLLNVDYEGKLKLREKYRGKKRCTEAAIAKMVEYADDGINYSQKCFICYSNCLEEAKEVAKQIKEKFKKMNGEPELYSIGTVIGCHTGSGTMSIFFWGKKRED